MTRCWCGAAIVNGAFCEQGHMQNRDAKPPAPAWAKVAIIAGGVALVLFAASGCADRPLKPDEAREYEVKPAPVCQPARDRHGRLIPGAIVCDPRRPPVIGSRIVKRRPPPTPQAGQ